MESDPPHLSSYALASARGKAPCKHSTTCRQLAKQDAFKRSSSTSRSSKQRQATRVSTTLVARERQLSSIRCARSDNPTGHSTLLQMMR
eukprot:6487174-Amphidinium_carterae.1